MTSAHAANHARGPSAGIETPPPVVPTLGLPLVRRGKVRDVYRLPPDPATGHGRLLMVASDRISAFDVIMPTPIPGKGALLTQIAAWWFGFIRRRGICETHLLSTDLRDLANVSGLEDPGVRGWLDGRFTICRECEVVPIECVVRGYLEGSGWKEYQETGAVCGVKLPRGLRQCDRLPEPIFTPATKAAHGHDENITFERAAEEVGLETMGVLRELSLSIYTAAAEHALSRGIIIADTKFEFGVPAEDKARAGRAWSQPILIDEALTPDSSRFWPADKYEPGRAQASFDKQFLREFLEEVVAAGKWNKTPPGPALPAHVIEGTLARYREARDRLCA
ncbi:MAG: phosphoribosylaminoimidazolesuccinocarboxamide synthase [Phycisphaeraceae bacterium]|nr:phosphoribosylaminoimidazolesuccinocarboxamide synthase [Phycisphaeraceae bacterium]MBX3408193.1 phosphoribosylaminoimidazolesuccinocarboxamide synthase [Phycisphaeraceae bacterium]